MTAFRALLRGRGQDLDGDPAALALLAQAWAGTGAPSPATYNQRLAILSSFYKFGRKQGQRPAVTWLP